MNRIILPVKPSLVEWRRLIGVPVAVVNWSIEAVTAADIPPELGVTAGSDGAWAVRSVELPLCVWTYDAIVSAIIRAEYPADRVEAIMANAALASISTTPRRPCKRPRPRWQPSKPTAPSPNPSPAKPSPSIPPSDISTPTSRAVRSPGQPVLFKYRAGAIIKITASFPPSNCEIGGGKCTFAPCIFRKGAQGGLARFS